MIDRGILGKTASKPTLTGGNEDQKALQSMKTLLKNRNPKTLPTRKSRHQANTKAHKKTAPTKKKNKPTNDKSRQLQIDTALSKTNDATERDN